jgi:hypothetical protein
VSGAAAVLSLVRAAGVRLRVDEVGRLKVAGRPEMVPPELLAGLRAHKAEIVELLRAGDIDQAANDDGSPPGPDQPCHGGAPPHEPDDLPRNGSSGPPEDALAHDSAPTRGEPPGPAARSRGFLAPEDEGPPDPATAPIGKCRSCGWMTPLGTRRTCWSCSSAESPATVEVADPPVQEPADHPPWTDDREWIRRWRTAGPTLTEREPVLRAWIAAAPPQPLPRCYAAVELVRIARNHGITVEIAP